MAKKKSADAGFEYPIKEIKAANAAGISQVLLDVGPGATIQVSLPAKQLADAKHGDIVSYDGGGNYEITSAKPKKSK